MSRLGSRIVFSDIDGTIVNNEHHAMQADATTFLQLMGIGVPVCLVSARSPSGIRSVSRVLGIEGGMASYSGALVLSESGDVLFSKSIALDEAAEIREFLRLELPDICVSTFSFDTWVCDSRNDPRIVREEYYVQTDATECSDLRLAFEGRGVHKFLLMGKPGQVEAARFALSEHYPDLVAVRSNPTLCEVMTTGVSKAHAVDVLCEHYGVDRSAAIAFGDGDNDLDMLAHVGTSFAMANASDAVKHAATHVCPYTNVEGGVAKTLETLLLG